MYDELIKNLRGRSQFLLPHYGEETSYDSDLMKQAADAIEELSKHRWIPVTERLPDAGERVLCYCRANIYEVMKMRTDGDWVYDTNHIYMHSFVTHWMPLPKPPKEEEDE